MLHDSDDTPRFYSTKSNHLNHNRNFYYSVHEEGLRELQSCDKNTDSQANLTGHAS